MTGCRKQDEITRYTVVRPVETVTDAKPQVAPTAPRDSGLKYETPEGWVAAKGNEFSRLAFEVQDEGRSIKITVSSAGGDLLSNVNRWRGQVGLPAVSQADFNKELKQLPVAGGQGNYVELVGPESASPRQAILGVILPVGNSSWFFKLQGDATLALKEKSHFEEFVQSVKFGNEEK